MNDDVRKKAKEFMRRNGYSLMRAAEVAQRSKAYLSLYFNRPEQLSENHVAAIEERLTQWMAEEDEVVQAAYKQCYAALVRIPLRDAKRVLRNLLTDVEDGR